MPAHQVWADATMTVQVFSNGVAVRENCAQAQYMHQVSEASSPVHIMHAYWSFKSEVIKHCTPASK